MVDVPAVTPVTIPLDDPIVATAVLPLLHAPPEVPLVNVVVLPMHTESVPPILAGSAYTVTILVAAQPVVGNR